MNNNYFFSVIVPCWNCSETIERLLDSLVNQQDTTKEEFEVILCDDGHEDNWITKINKYKDLLNIVYIQTKEHKIHCPGNTRRDALPYARGEWITFIDNDDFIVADALKIAKKNIIENNIKYVLAGQAIETDLFSFKTELTCKYSLTLLHGKFYNRNFLNKYNINFKENMKTHEDLFFNTQALCGVFQENEEHFYWIENYLYIWAINSHSFSRSYKSIDGKNYLEANFAEYLEGLSYSYLKLIQNKKDFKENKLIKTQLIYAILYGYLYYEAELYNLKEKAEPEFFILIKYIKKIMKICNYTKEEIINLIYEDPLVYEDVRKQIPFTSGPFIENQSFKDFIMINIDEAEDQSNNS